MKIFLLIVGLIMLIDGSVFGNEFDPSQTKIIESNENFVIIENKSSLVQVKNSFSILLNTNYEDAANQECIKNGKIFFSQEEDGPNASMFSDAHYIPLSDYKGKMFCLTDEEKYQTIVNAYNNLLFDTKRSCREFQDTNYDSYLNLCIETKESLRMAKIKLKEIQQCNLDFFAIWADYLNENGFKINDDIYEDLCIDSKESLRMAKIKLKEIQKNSIIQAKLLCTKIGFREETEKMASCILTLMLRGDAQQKNLNHLLLIPSR